MPKVAVYNIEGRQVGEIELNETVFGAEVNKSLLHQVVVNQQANRRRGTAATKNRTQVSGGGRKPWRQKGTGRARVGSIRSPLWVGGGTIFGPSPRDYSYRMPKKARRAALRSALSSKVADGSIVVLDELVLNEAKTRTMVGILSAVKAAKKPIVVLADWDERIDRAARNIPGVLVSKSLGLNVYDLLNHENLVITKDAVAKLEEVLA